VKAARRDSWDERRNPPSVPFHLFQFNLFESEQMELVSVKALSIEGTRAMKKIILTAALALGLGTAAFGANIMTATPTEAAGISIHVGTGHHYHHVRYHHRHRVCTWHHHHRRCYWR
jgi:hypothetical protein